MTRTSSRPGDRALAGRPDPAATAEDPAPVLLRVVRALLRERGWRARVEVLDVCGDPDVRLRVVCPGSPVHVELLGLQPSSAGVQRWCAVRVTRQRRVVWRGPRLGCAAGDLVRFVEALGAGDAVQPDQDFWVLS